MNRSKPIIVCAAAVIMAAGFAMIWHLKAVQRLGNPGVKMTAATHDSGGQEIDLPDKVDGYVSQSIPPAPVEISVLPKDTTFGGRLYQSTNESGFVAQLRVVLMGSDRTSLHRPQLCLTGQGWQIEKTVKALVPIPKPNPYQLDVLELTASKQVLENGHPVKYRGIYLYWFVTEGSHTSDLVERNWESTRELLRHGTLLRWAYVSYFSVCRPGEEEATEKRLKELMAASVPEFQVADRRLTAR